MSVFYGKRGRVNSTVRAFFSEDATSFEVTFYVVAVVLVWAYGAIAVLSPFLAPACDKEISKITYGNKDYVKDPCKFTRYAALGGLNMWECIMCSRIFYSLVLGSLIGWERRRADRAAGIRTMAMVCLGSCVFTIDSIYAFVDGPMSWDASRVSAAIPSGVGFLGAASIWKGTVSKNGNSAPEVHGLTTATSVWLSAAVGILVGGGLFAPAIFSTLASIIYLRFAPRAGRGKASEQEGDEEAARHVSIASVVTQSQLTEPIVAAPKRANFSLERKASIHI